MFKSVMIFQFNEFTGKKSEKFNISHIGHIHEQLEFTENPYSASEMKAHSVWIHIGHTELPDGRLEKHTAHTTVSFIDCAVPTPDSISNNWFSSK